MQRDKAIDAVRGLAILLVMIGHCIVLNGLHSTDPYVYDAIKSVQMPLFMTVSGVLAGMSLSRGERVNRKTIRKRAVAYLVPFFSWFVLVFLVTHIADGTIGFSLFFRELYELLRQTDKGLWFLTTLFVIMLAVSAAQNLADLILQKSNRADRAAAWIRVLLFLFFTGCLYVVFFVQGRSSFQLLSPSLTLQYMPYYVIGYLIYGYGGEVTGSLPAQTRKCCDILLWLLWGICATGFLFLVIRFDLTKAPASPGELMLQMAASMLGTYVCYFGMYRLAQKHEMPFLSFVGMYTLEIYVLHFRFARLIPLRGKEIAFYSLEGIGYLACVFAVMSVCTALCILFIQKSGVLTFLLFGKRKAPRRPSKQKIRQSHTSSDKSIG